MNVYQEKATHVVRRSQISLLIIAVLATVVACGGSTMGPTISLTEAQSAAEKDVRDAAAAIFPSGFTLEQLGAKLTRPCTDSFNKQTGQFAISVDYWVNGIDATRNNEYFDLLKNWWPTGGWVLSSDDRPKNMFMNADKNGYLMSLQSTNISNGRLSIGVGAPCVWRNGTPEPKG